MYRVAAGLDGSYHRLKGLGLGVNQMEGMAEAIVLAGNINQGVGYIVYRGHVEVVPGKGDALHLDDADHHPADHIVDLIDAVGCTGDVAGTIDGSL